MTDKTLEKGAEEWRKRYDATSRAFDEWVAVVRNDMEKAAGDGDISDALAVFDEGMKRIKTDTLAALAVQPVTPDDMAGD